VIERALDEREAQRLPALQSLFVPPGWQMKRSMSAVRQLQSATGFSLTAAPICLTHEIRNGALEDHAKALGIDASIP